jgi:hypothetical protein
MARLIVALSFLIVSVGAIAGAVVVGTSTSLGAVLVNMGTEIFGILITIAVVEWFFDRKRLQDRARELSWGMLHAIERGVWTWQGGPQQVGTEELLGIIAGIKTIDSLTPTTRTLLVNVGAKAREAMNKEPKVVRTLPGLIDALQDLQSFRSLQDGDSSVSVRMVSEVLESSVTNIARVLNLPTQRIPAALIRYRDASEKRQQERFYTAGPGTMISAPEDDRSSNSAANDTRFA